LKYLQYLQNKKLKKLKRREKAKKRRREKAKKQRREEEKKKEKREKRRAKINKNNYFLLIFYDILLFSLFGLTINFIKNEGASIFC